jgi:hypothetical protein
VGNLPLCNRCGEEIVLANDLDQAPDIDRRRHLVLVAGKPRRLTPTFWRLFTLLYAHRRDVVGNDQLHAELYRDVEQPMAGNVIRENVRRLRKVLASRVKVRDRQPSHPRIRADRRRCPWQAGRLATTLLGLRTGWAIWIGQGSSFGRS